ncbi:DUF4129 domain-containing protein [Arenibacter certesii]|uniref:Protein-glutamine gamma-glutamyltransferase-like C-terminal domain-containing protein n=1 Tax=Arenibacter certesii TaxID=228955 RepID=A0A918IV21_9FLAO|nr:DUF4129 domain-containing protein [Arenibacter certesii]GGW33283.1 hypothetical protein GCM10007383_17930 [Arenibacter certesii]
MIKAHSTFCTIFSYSLGFPQRNKDTLALAEDNSTAIIPRRFKGDLNERYSGNNFNYDVGDGESQNLISRFLTWLSDWLQKLLGIDLPPGTAQVLEIIVYILMGLLAIYLLIRFLTGEQASAIFSKKATSFGNLDLSEEHIENIDLDSLLATALSQNNYRSAIRYQYLKALKTLSQKEIIVWQYKKTNQDYQNEISRPDIKSVFKEISYLYDYVWYGEQEIDAPKYRAAQIKFDHINKLGGNG